MIEYQKRYRMHLTIIAAIGDIVFFCVMLGLIGTALRYIFFLPYRNKFMRWYMRYFSKYYRAAKVLFDEFISKKKQYGLENDHLILDTLQLDQRFRSTEFGEKLLRQGEPLTTDELLSEKCSVFRSYEQFVYFSGKGRNFHKVVIFFDLDGGIELRSIKLFYHEENGRNSFFHMISEQKFDPGPLAKARKVPALIPM